MDENKMVADLIKLYADNSGYFKDALDQAQTAMYVSIVAILASLVIGYWNFFIAKKGLKSQTEKTYREIITSERIRWVNDLRKDAAQFLTLSSEINFMINNEDFTNVLNHKDVLELLGESKNKYFMIKMRMNPKGEAEAIILKKCNDLMDHLADKSNTDNRENIVKSIIEDLANDFQTFFKKEWERSKQEIVNYCVE